MEVKMVVFVKNFGIYLFGVYFCIFCMLCGYLLGIYFEWIYLYNVDFGVCLVLYI